jgi:HSP20 family protein
MPTTVRWSPRRELVSLREAMDRLLEDALTEMPGQRRGEARLPIDVYTTPEEIVVRAPVPGVAPEDVGVTLDGDTLMIRADLPGPLENVEYIFQECPSGPLSRVLTLNVPIDVENIEATFEHGLLILRLPKTTPAKPRTIKIDTKSD